MTSSPEATGRRQGGAPLERSRHPPGRVVRRPPTGQHGTMSGITIYRIAGGKAVEGWNSIEVKPTEEEQRWLSEGGGWPGRSGDIPATEQDPSPPFWDVLTRNLTWRSRVEEARERERIEQELQVARQIQQALLPEAVPRARGLGANDLLRAGSGGW